MTRRCSRIVWPGLAAMCVAWLAGSAPAAQAPAWKCLTADGTTCAAGDLVNPDFRQILVLSGAYGDASAGRFWEDLEILVHRLSSAAAGNAWSVQKRDRLLYVGLFVAGGALNADETLGVRILEDPAGEPTLAVDTDLLHQLVDRQRAQMPWLQPLAAAVLVQSDAGPTPNASPPSFLGRPYGIALFTSADIRTDLLGTYVGTHELAHAALNFLDEYVEAGLERESPEDLQPLVPELILGGVHSPGVRQRWDMRFAEILAGNGPANLAPRRDVSTVPTPGVQQQRFEYEGGLFFGRGTFHDAGANLMNADAGRRTPRDGFAFDHSPSQQQFIDALFGDSAPPPNDRLRQAGPVSGFDLSGPTVELLLYDGDKRNTFHGTQQYVVQVGWWESGPRTPTQWRVEEYVVTPTEWTAELPLTGARREEHELLRTMCRAGMTELSTRLSGRDVCDRQDSAFLPTLGFYLPYESVTVGVPNQFTTYWWRFRTWNGTTASGWTGWASFYRSL